MAEHGHDDEIGRRYRELPREEPPRALDEAILAAARRELETRPAPLVAPTGRRRWMFPVAAAAVILLSAVITLHIQREQPDLELASVPPPPAPPAARQEEKSGTPPPPEAQPHQRMTGVEGRTTAKEAEQAQLRREQPRPAPGATVAREAPKEGAAQSSALADSMQSKTAEEPRRFVPDPAPPAAAPQMAQPRALAAAPASRPARELDAPEAPRDALSRRADASLAKAEIAGESPEKMLERIATLRREGRQKEADDLYAEFRKRFPDYRIPEKLREQVLPR